ncbi:MAG: hypothetical protein RL754_1346 [Bacteroidota bacterium]|jgi:hypothetical protein
MNLQPLEKHLPSAAVIPLLEQWLRPYDFTLKITRPRASKLGDFRPPRPGQRSTITLNGNLRPYQFLTTLVHEIAHLVVWERYGRKAAPHGMEWKRQFGLMLEELALCEKWPDAYHNGIVAHSRKPKASVGADPKLQRILLELDGLSDTTLLGDLDPTESFHFRSRTFTYLEKRRSRALVEDVQTGKKYTIALIAEVERA